MDSRKEAKLSMYNVVLTHIEANNAIAASVPAFAAAATTLRTIYNNIVQAAQQETLAITGITIDKTEARLALCNEAAQIAAAIFAYASSISNNELKQQVNYPVSKLRNTNDELLIPVCNNISEIAIANQANLTTYGITATTISDFGTSIEDYQELIPNPRNAVSSRSAVRTSITNLFKESDAVLKNQMDKLALQFKTTEEEFYNTYKNNRIILDAATFNTQASGTITDSETNLPVASVAVQVIGQSYTTTSNANGVYTVKIPVPGTYNISFSVGGYNNKTQTVVVVTLGQSTALNIQLVPLPA
jgi:hypothetical protein